MTSAADIRSELAALEPRLRRFALRISGCIDEAEDIVQAAYEKALSRLDHFVPGTRIDSWMYRIVETVRIDRLRRRRRTAWARQDVDIAAVGYDQRIHEVTEARLDLEIVCRMIDEVLAPDQREVLRLACFDELSYRECADRLGVPVGTIMSRLSRARLKLARAMEAARSMKAAEPGGE
ncbi:MAG: RNA polymerase sigma factor [Hyphomicrobiaceae bacterium]|nr:RNA polymerase sigma factor [Hyphomicrobiaceae bacterium]